MKVLFVDPEKEYGRQRVFNSAMETLDAHTSSKKLDIVFEKLNCAAKFHVAFAFALKNLGDETDRYYYAHANNTLMERPKILATKEDLVKSRKC